MWVDSLDILLCCALAQFLEVALGDESFHVSLSNVELAVLCQSDGTAQEGQQPISAEFNQYSWPTRIQSGFRPRL